VRSRIGAPDTGDLWRLTMEHSPVGMALVSPEGEILTANVALCDMLGYDPDVLTTMTSRDVTHPDDRATDRRLVGRALAGETSSYRVTKRYVRADGSVLVGDVCVALLRDADGSPMHFISQVADLTERQAFTERLDAADEAAYDMQRKAEALFESVSVGLLLVDAEGNYTAYNRRQRELLEIAFPEGHLGHAGQGGFVYDADGERTLRPDEIPCARAAAGHEFDDLLIWIGKDPTSRRAISVSARGVRDRIGGLTGAVLAYNDVTELIRAVKVKDDFVSSVSHELRTPLASALAHLELLDESADVSSEVHEQISAARRNALRLSHLVADLLFAARAGSGSSVIDPYRVDLVTVVSEALAAAELQAAGSGVALTSPLPDTLVVMADGLRLRQVLDNLVANALAYTPSGGHVEVTLEEAEGRVVLTVSDDGEGIDKAEVPDVFAPFVRGANARRRQVPGTGLGLSIVRTIVEAHGGEVTMESGPGMGTAVRVSLPR
jgi:two-component system phosphate regulon sensor histidine kinase PhoR